MIRAQRPSHHPKAQHRVALLQGEATQEVRPVDDQKEMAVRSTGPGQPPRSQERRWKRRRIHQLIPLRRPLIEVGTSSKLGAATTESRAAWSRSGRRPISRHQSSRGRLRHSHAPSARTTSRRPGGSHGR